MGKLYGGEDRVWESVVTYPLSQRCHEECVRWYFCFEARHSDVVNGRNRVFAYQCCLASTLHAVETNKERGRLLAFRGVELSMLGDSIEDEWHAVLGLVVDDFRHFDLIVSM